MCKNKIKSLTYECSRKGCKKIVHFKKGSQLKAYDYTGCLNFADWKYCEDCFNEIIEIISDFNKSNLSDIYSRAKYVLMGEDKKLKELKELYEGKSYKEKTA